MSGGGMGLGAGSTISRTDQQTVMPQYGGGFGGGGVDNFGGQATGGSPMRLANVGAGFGINGAQQGGPQNPTLDDYGSVYPSSVNSDNFNRAPSQPMPFNQINFDQLAQLLRGIGPQIQPTVQQSMQQNAPTYPTAQPAAPVQQAPAQPAPAAPAQQAPMQQAWPGIPASTNTWKSIRDARAELFNRPAGISSLVR